MTQPADFVSQMAWMLLTLCCFMQMFASIEAMRRGREGSLFFRFDPGHARELPGINRRDQPFAVQ
jgi:hypothetical protein